MKRLIPASVVCLLIGGLLMRPLLASGFPVFDAANFQQAVQQLLQMEQQYRQLVATYRTVRDQYEHMQRMSRHVPVNMLQRYRALATRWQPARANNRSGRTAAWIEAINSGLETAAGYAAAVEGLGRYDDTLSGLSAEQAERVMKSYATVELADGANVASIDLLGRLRANSAAVEQAIEGLEEDSLSLDPLMNSEIAVLNKINAAHLIAVRNSQDSNKLLVAMAEAQVVDAKRKRDAEAQAINQHIRMRREGKAVLDAQGAGMNDALRAWRMP
jgi:hypothetical protein